MPELEDVTDDEGSSSSSDDWRCRTYFTFISTYFSNNYVNENFTNLARLAGRILSALTDENDNEINFANRLPSSGKTCSVS